GLHLAALPSELIGVWTGALLIIVISIDGWARARNRLISSPAASTQEFTVKNSQIAILCGTILAAALIVAVTNAWLVRSIAPGSAAVSSSRPVIAMMPKAKGDPYFVSVRGGAEEAARDLGVELIWDGPTGLEAAKQNEIVENWITRHVDVIAVAVENKAG